MADAPSWAVTFSDPEGEPEAPEGASGSYPTGCTNRGRFEAGAAVEDSGPERW